MHMSPEETAHWKHRLRDEERRLGRRFANEEASLDSEDDASFGTTDDAVAAALREGTYGDIQGREEGQTSELREITDAWRRLDSGTYGVCEVCGEHIPKERLEILPYTRYCVRHAQ